MKILIAADAHGIAGIVAAEKAALARGIPSVVIAGDVWDVNHARRLDTHYIRGNHERDEYWGDQVDNVTLHPDYSTFLLGGLKFGVLGRKDPDVVDEVLKKRPDVWLGHHSNRSFVKRDDAAQLLAGSDVLLLHESPWPFVGNGWVGGSGFLKDLVETVRPQVVFHGDMHQLQTRRWEGVEIIGLPPIDPEYVQHGYAVLDTETLDVEIVTTVRPLKQNVRNI